MLQSQHLNMDGFKKSDDLLDLIQTKNQLSMNRFGTGILLVEPHTHKILLAHRKDNGLLASPGGKVELGESPLMGIVRETLEESGVKVNSAYCYATHQHESTNSDMWTDFCFISHDFDASHIKPQAMEMGEYKWYNTDEAMRENLFPPCAWAIQEAIDAGQLPMPGSQDELKYIEAIDTREYQSPLISDGYHCEYTYVPAEQTFTENKGDGWLPWD